MSNFSISINLKDITGAMYRDIKGRSSTKRCIVIPVDDNPAIFVGRSGVYLSLMSVEMRTPGQYGDTHFIKESIPGDVFKGMSEDEQRSIPIVGNMKPVKFKREELPTEGVAPIDLGAVEEDLPF